MNDLKNKYEILSSSVDKEIGDILEEFTLAIKLLGNDRQYVRTRLLLNFSLLEVICTIYNSYYNLRLNNRKLLKKYINEYLLVEKNVVYKKHKDIKNITIEHLYKFRNSIIHAFALPEAEGGLSIVVPNGSEKTNVIDKMRNGFIKAGHKVAFISPDSLTALFTAGAQMLLSEIFGSKIVTQWDYDALLRVNTEIERRGSKSVSLYKIARVKMGK